jgi:hypothetical protein
MGWDLTSCRPVVAWRGWQVDVVINYDLPTSSKDYVHRVGRTGESNGHLIEAPCLPFTSKCQRF